MAGILYILSIHFNQVIISQQLPRLRIHAVERNNRAIAGFLKKNMDEIDFSCPLPVVPEYLENAERIMAEAGIPAGRKIIGIATGTRWVTKQWEPE